jgi:cell division septum initiation protein DivIVA
MVDEERIIEQLDLIRLSLPEAFHEAESIVRHKEEIFLQSEQYAQEIIETAERRASQMIAESGIVRQAEMQAQQIRQRVQQECEAIREQTIAEIDRMRRQAQQELEEMQRIAIAECEEIQAGADDYADRTLQEMEAQLAEMLRIVRNGRHQLQPEAPTRREMGLGGGMRPSQMRGGKSL